MKGWQGMLCSGVLLATLAPRLAHANAVPARDRYDARMRQIPYNPGEVVHLQTLVGNTLVVSFGAREVVTAVAETDTLHLQSVPKGNYLFLKPGTALPLQPVIVLTALPSGELRRYVFEIQTVPERTADGTSAVFYSVQFTYPAEEAAAAAASAAAAQAETAKLNARAAENARQTTTETILASERTNPDSGPRNYKYVAQGNRALAPVSIWDNGYSTVLTFPGNTTIPAVFVIDPDGKEATASYAVHGSVVEIGQTARAIRLREGNTALNIFNLGYNTVGSNPGTGTVSPAVTRRISIQPGGGR